MLAPGRAPDVPLPAEADALVANRKDLRLSEIYLWLDPEPGVANAVQYLKDERTYIQRSTIR